ncbi:helix-turn-helix domain-containing protein [Pseudomonas sp. FW300-N2A2]|nr:helix-turn-helix domain-containing protein [Pseudomonas sp. FW300-N2A2]
MFYHDLSVEERVTIQIGQLHDMSQREIVRLLNFGPDWRGFS